LYCIQPKNNEIAANEVSPNNFRTALVNLDKIWKHAVVAMNHIPSWHLTGETEEIHGNLYVLRFSWWCNGGFRCSGILRCVSKKCTAFFYRSHIAFFREFLTIEDETITFLRDVGIRLPMTQGVIAGGKKIPIQTSS
jgi:hypothetical protein